MARVTGLEPATSGVTGRRSNQLSYTRRFGRASLGCRAPRPAPECCQPPALRDAAFNHIFASRCQIACQGKSGEIEAVKLPGSVLRGLRTVAGLFAVTASSAHAEPRVALDSAVFVERQLPGSVRSLEPVSRLNRRRPGRHHRHLAPGKRPNRRHGGGFTVTNPLPRAIAYQGSAQDDEEVSIDGGRSWGRLGTLRIGDRLASAEDVTHVRWRVGSGHAARGEGQIAYSGIVR